VPTVLRSHGFKLFFYASDRNEPPHVHVRRGDGEAKYWLEPLALEYSERFTRAEARRVRKIVRTNRELLKERWNEYFGLY
jgi:hypothetical protein